MKVFYVGQLCFDEDRLQKNFFDTNSINFHIICVINVLNSKVFMQQYNKTFQ